MRLKIKDALPDCLCPDGWEIIKTNGEYFIGRHIPLETRKKARAQIKGIKILVREANQIGFFEKAGSAYTGNKIDPKIKFEQLSRGCDSKTLIGIGFGQEYGIESYVDGTYQVFLK